MSQEIIGSKYSKKWGMDIYGIGSSEKELYCESYIRQVESDLNDKLSRRGFVFLNEVYERFEIPFTKAGQVVGWVKYGGGDNHIEISFEKIEEDSLFSVVYLLHFNVDGDITHILEEF